MKLVICSVIFLFGSLPLKVITFVSPFEIFSLYRGADKSLAQPGRKQATATADCDVYISYL